MQPSHPTTLYMFERGVYPRQTIIAERELATDAAAIEHAERIGADYVWAAHEGQNPHTVWRSPKARTTPIARRSSSPLLHEQVAAVRNAFDDRGYIASDRLLYVDVGAPDVLQGGDGESPIIAASGDPTLIGAIADVAQLLPALETAAFLPILLRSLVDGILHLPFSSQAALEAQRWSAQGLGMLRHYLTKEVRLHIWDRRLRVAGVSAIHDHPWSFTSYVVVGRICNVVYERCTPMAPGAKKFNRACILCGEGAHTLSEATVEYMRVKSTAFYEAGQSYETSSDEIHESLPEDGTVTVIHRRFDKPVVDQATIWWPGDGAWVSAEPRPATPKEVLDALRLACNRLDGTYDVETDYSPIIVPPRVHQPRS